MVGWRMSKSWLIAATLDVCHCRPPCNHVQATSTYSDLPLLKTRRIQALFQQQHFLIAFYAPELLLGFQKSGGGPAQRLISFSPALSGQCMKGDYVAAAHAKES